MTKKEYYQKNKKVWHERYYLPHKEKVHQRNVERLKILQKWLKEYKSKLKCEKCGESHPATLDFHHKNQQEKNTNIARMVSNRTSLKRLEEEIKKCFVWCSNCHRKHHYRQEDDL